MEFLQKLSDLDRLPSRADTYRDSTLSQSINRSCMSLDCGKKKPENPKRTRTDAVRTINLHTEGP